MTLDIAKYLENLVKKEAKISHFSIKVQAGSASTIQPEVKTSIQASYGDSYLEDADYLLFFTKPEGWQTGDKKKLFDFVNRGLGKDANGMTENDFKAYEKSESAASTDDGSAEDEETDKTENDADKATNTVFLKVTVK